jgi:hypothetical protein
MEVLKLDVVCSYSYKPDIEIVSYDENNTSYTKECVICKRSLLEPSYETLSDNKNIANDNEILIGKCGHVFHGDCLCKWLKTSECCPIDKVKWCLHRVADTTTKLVMYNCSNTQNNYKRKFDETNIITDKNKDKK